MRVWRSAAYQASRRCCQDLWTGKFQANSWSDWRGAGRAAHQPVVRAGPHLLVAWRSTETRPEELECLLVIPALRDNRAEYRRESVTRNAEKIGPRPVFTGFINQRLADIKNNGPNHAGILQYARSMSASVSCHAHWATATIQCARRNANGIPEQTG